MKQTFRSVILRLPEELIDRVDAVVHEKRCRSRSQFIRTALQLQVAHHEQQIREKATGADPRSRSEKESAHNAHIRSRLQDALIHAPAKWSFDRLEGIENDQMSRVEQETKRVPNESVATLPFLTLHADAAIKALNLHISNQVKVGKKR